MTPMLIKVKSRGYESCPDTSGCLQLLSRWACWSSRPPAPKKPNVLLHSIADRVDLLGDRRRALELQMKLFRLLCGEGLPAMRALERAIQLDPDILEASVARLGT